MVYLGLAEAELQQNLLGMLGETGAFFQFADWLLIKLGRRSADLVAAMIGRHTGYKTVDQRLGVAQDFLGALHRCPDAFQESKAFTPVSIIPGCEYLVENGNEFPRVCITASAVNKTWIVKQVPSVNVREKIRPPLVHEQTDSYPAPIARLIVVCQRKVSVILRIGRDRWGTDTRSHQRLRHQVGAHHVQGVVYHSAFAGSFAAKQGCCDSAGQGDSASQITDRTG